jgi:hypothetical protein
MTEKEKLVRYLRDMADSLEQRDIDGWWASVQKRQIEVPPEKGWRRFATDPVAHMVVLWW